MSSRRTYRIWLGLAVLAFCAGLALWVWNRYPSDLRWIQRISGITFPGGVRDLHVARPREFCISGRMTLPASGVDAFLKANGFTLQSEYPLNADLGVNTAVFTNPPSLTQWYGLKGHTQTERWEFACDPTRQALWFVVLFPDFHGDPPP